MDQFYYWLSVIGTLLSILNFIGFFLILMSRTYRYNVYNISKIYNKGQKVIYGVGMLSFMLTVSISVFGWAIFPAAMVRDMDSPVVSWLISLVSLELVSSFLIITMIFTKYGPVTSPAQIAILNICILLFYCVTHEFDSHYGVSTALSVLSILINTLSAIYPLKLSKFISIPAGDSSITPLNASITGQLEGEDGEDSSEKEEKVSCLGRLCCISPSDLAVQAGFKSESSSSSNEPVTKTDPLKDSGKPLSGTKKNGSE
jgi:hypothetical protein